MEFIIRVLFLLAFSNLIHPNELDRIAVIVNDGVVLESEIVQEIIAYKKDAAINGMIVGSEKEVRESVTERLILEELQLQIADRVGIKISDEELNVTLKRIAQSSDMTLETFIDFIEKEGTLYDQFREKVKNQLKIQRVQQGRIQNKISIPKEELDNFLNTDEAKFQLGPELKVFQILIKKNDSASIQDALGKVKGFLDGGMSSESAFAELSSDENKGDLGWRKITEFPALFQEEIDQLEIGQFSNIVESGVGSHILYLDNKRGPSVKFEKQWEVRHILISPNRIRDLTASENLINDLRKMILSGESNFTDLAKEFSDDPGSKQEGGNLGWAGEGRYVFEFEQRMIAEGINVVSEPFLTENGWHILEVLNTRVKDKTDENIAEQAFSYLYNRKFEEELETDLQELRADAFIEIKES